MEQFVSAFLFVGENFFLYVVALIFALVFLVVIHELGHYLAARWCGVRVDKFSVGFGKELWGFTDKRGMRWSFSAIPAGGYVQIFGDVDPLEPKLWDKKLEKARPLTSEELNVAFCTKSIWQRLLIVLAGPFVNIAFAVILVTAVYVTYGQSSSPAIITGIDVNDVAYKAGFKRGDEILSIDGVKVRKILDVVLHIRHEYEKPSNFTIKRNDQILNIQLKPREVKYTDLKGIERSHGRAGLGHFRGLKLEEVISVAGIDTRDNPDKARELLLERMDQTVLVGLEYRQDEISIYEFVFPSDVNSHLHDKKSENYDKIFIVDKDKRLYIRLPLMEALSSTIYDLWSILPEAYKRISATLGGKNDDQIFAGVGKLSDYAAKSAESGLYSYIFFLCIFSFQLAIINLLPIPALDGGYVVFLAIEALRGRPVSQKTQNIALIIGIVLLGGIMVFANFSDLIYLLR